MQPQSDTIQGVGSELLSDAKGVGTSTVNRLHSEVDARKGDAATQVKSVSSAIEQAASGLDPNTPTWLKSAFEQGAQQVQKFAETLEQKDSRQLVSDVSDFARSSPATFLGACAAAGFAAARIFKAGSSENTPAQPASIGTDKPMTGNYHASGNYQPTGDPQTGSSTPAASTSSPRADFAS